MTLLAFCCGLCLSHGQSCEIDGVSHSTFNDVKLILDDNNCNSCHSGQQSMGNWNYDTYESFITSGDCDKRVILHGDASNSYFYGKISGVDACGDESDNIHRISTDELNQIESWINFGAPEFCISLYSDVRAILDNNNCNSCHGNDPQAWRYDSYLNLIDSDLNDNCSDQRVVVKGNSSESLLYDKINNDGFVSCGEPMNSDTGPMSKTDVAKIRDWINSGANETAASLPVILSEFTVKNNQNNVELRWSTEVEIGTDKFIIERSPSGLDFEAIDELTSQGSSSFGYSYRITDENPLIGDNYYRLKILDLDGTYNYSNIRLIRVKSEETVVTVYPNPAENQITIEISKLQ